MPNWCSTVYQNCTAPARQLRSYVQNRWITQTHVLKTGLKPGQWHEFDQRLLHAAFTDLVRYVEVELAYLHVWCSAEAAQQFGFRTPWWKRKLQLRQDWWKWNWIIHWPAWRSAQAGVAHLRWASSLVYTSEQLGQDQQQLLGQPTAQAQDAQLTLQLYEWWTQHRPNRADVTKPVTDWMQQHPDLCFFTLQRPEHCAERQQLRDLLAQQAEQEEQQYAEDTQQLIQLVQLRRSIWS